MACVQPAIVNMNFADVMSSRRRSAASKSGVRRKLNFGESTEPVTAVVKDTETLLSEMLAIERKRVMDRWNFDCEIGKPAAGNYSWVAIPSGSVPSPYISKQTLGETVKVQKAKLKQLKISDFMKVKKRKIADPSHSQPKSKRRNLRRI